FQIVRRKIEILIGMVTPSVSHSVAVRHRIVTGQDRGPALEIMTSGRNALTRRPEYRRVKARGKVDVSDRLDESVQLACHIASSASSMASRILETSAEHPFASSSFRGHLGQRRRPNRSTPASVALVSWNDMPVQ